MRPSSEAELAEAVAGASGPLLVRGGGTRTLGHAVGEVLETGGVELVQREVQGARPLLISAGTTGAE
ncbi:hypothetical protein [Tabrizicola sp.]|uniref:hypothetical protein n=1 Tax=Tabrizicola sp. TaxID=2005166 RepID=UPI0035AFE40E